jgi:tRNA(fMet)-specific endonuclease VapC
MRYMLDTNICIYVARGDDTALLEKLESFFVGDLVMSAITLAELEAGVRRDAGLHRRREEALGELVRFIEPVAFDERAAACFGDLQAAMEDRKRGGYDRLIGAHAISLWLPLVTNNVRDFCDMPGLRLENWAAG